MQQEMELKKTQADSTQADGDLGYGVFAISIRPLFAVLALLLCVVAARADKPIVIKDSEAVQYVGREVEVQGCVVSVITSPLGTTFINFGGEYPNQKFAGFIAAGSKVASDQRLTIIQGKIITITGTIRLRDGKPEIEVVSANQIKGSDFQPVD